MENTSDSQMNRLSIGQMAKINRVSEKTLRVYHKRGILIPDYINYETGFRYYNLYQCSTLDMIQQMKELGFSLDEIKHFIDENNVDLLKEHVNSKLQTIENDLARLNHAKRMGETLVRNCDNYKQHPPFDEVSYEDLPERQILRLVSIQTSPEPTVDKAIANWEYTLRACKKLMLEGSFPSTLFRNISDTMTAESLRQEQPYYGEAIVFVDSSYPEVIHLAETVPGGLFAVMYCDTFSDENNRYTEPGLVKKMVQQLRKDGFEVAGDYIGEVLAETPMFYERRHNMLTKMQIPVIKRG